MTPAKLWLRLFLIGYAVLVPLWLISLTSPTPYGDLTRIGRLSERDFGWTVDPPTFDAAYVRGTPIDQADILVIGDSFSMTFRWQASLVKAGYRVATTYWGQYDNGFCSDFEQRLAQIGFKGKLVILESVERLLDERTRRSSKCSEAPVGVQAGVDPFIKPALVAPGFGPNWDATFTTGILTYYNTWRAERATSDIHFEWNTWVRAVPDGCQYFSHRLCEKMPFFAEDEDNGPLTLETLARMKAFKEGHPGVPMLWLVIPNKTTVYIKPDFSKDFEAGLRGSNLGPDLYAFTREQRARVRDLYFPNDTHLSMHGQLQLGERALQAVREVLPNAPARAP